MYLRGLYGRPGGCDRLKRTIVSHGNSAAISSLIASAADDTGFGDGSLAAPAALDKQFPLIVACLTAHPRDGRFGQLASGTKRVPGVGSQVRHRLARSPDITA